MNLLLNRKQSHTRAVSLIPLRIGSGVTFTLSASLELTDEERALVKQYKLYGAALVVSNPIEDLRNAFRPALLLGFVVFALSLIFVSATTAFVLGLLVTIGMTVVYFKTLREQILVSDLTSGGRKFRCDSVVDLIQKEAYLEGVCQYLRQVLESAKAWTDREIIPIEPLDAHAAKQAVLNASGS